MESDSTSPKNIETTTDEIDLGELLGVVLDGKWKVLFVSLLFLSVGAAYAWFSAPVYEADTLLQVETSANNTPFDDIASFIGEEVASETEIEVIRSRTLVGAVVDKLNLQLKSIVELPIWDRTAVRERPSLEIERFEIPEAYLNQEFRIELLANSEYILSFKDDVLSEGIIGKALYVSEPPMGLFISSATGMPGTKFKLNKVSRAEAIKQLQNDLVVSEKGKKTGVIRVALQGEDNQLLQEILNTLANLYVQRNVEQKSEQAQKSLEFLDKQLPALRRKVDAAEIELSSYLSENQLVDLTAESQSVLTQLVTLEEQISALNLKRAELEQEFNSLHPALVSLREQERQLAEQRDNLENEIKKLPDAQQTALRLKRDVEVSNVLYTFLLNKAQELRVVKAGTVGNVRVLDHAFLPYAPVKPKKSLILVLSLGLGLMTSIALVLLKRAMNPSIRSSEEVEQTLGIPVYATIPTSDAETKFSANRKRKDGSRKLLAANEPKDQAVEAMRSLRTSLHFSLMQADNNRVAVSGPSPGIGKSFVSANLGFLLAEIDKSVVLIDADLRKGHCHEYFSVERDNGVTEYVSGETDDIGSLLKPHPKGSNLSLVSTGKVPPNPSELLLSPRFLKLLDQLSDRFDLVIVDTPPILAVADAGIILPHMGASFVVARAQKNSIAELKQSVKRLSQDGAKISGIIVNGMDRKAASYKYGAYKYYNYNYE